MANATATENCLFDQNCDDLDVDELSNIDISLITSLLEDSLVEDGDEEMLRTMIQSLEPDINSCSETYSSDNSSSDDCQFSDVDQVESCSTSPDHRLDFDWIDMEMAYSYLNDDMARYVIGHFAENIETLVELGVLGNYSQVCWNGMPMEEDDYIGLWQ